MQTTLGVKLGAEAVAKSLVEKLCHQVWRRLGAEIAFPESLEWRRVEAHEVYRQIPIRCTWIGHYTT